MASTQEYSTIKVTVSNQVVQAMLSFKLINGDGKDPAQVYGIINGRFSIDRKFTVFDKKRDQHIDIRPGEYFPLSQRDVNVPEGATEMEIEAYLMEYDSDSPDNEIANGKAVFLVKEPGVSEKKPINGRFGSIEVNVTWG